MSGKPIAVSKLAVLVSILFGALFLLAACGEKNSDAETRQVSRKKRRRPDNYTALHSACVNNLKQFGLVLRMFANDHKEKTPPIDNVKGNFMIEADAVYPEYLTDMVIMACPADKDYAPRTQFRLERNAEHPETAIGRFHPDCLTCESYIYLGWVVTSEAEGLAAIDAYLAASPEDLDKDLVVPPGMGNGGGDKIARLSFSREEGIESWSEIPIAWEWPGHHGELASVLYLDGRVELLRYPSRFPMTERFIEKLRSIEADISSDCPPVMSR